MVRQALGFTWFYRREVVGVSVEEREREQEWFGINAGTQARVTRKALTFGFSSSSARFLRRIIDESGSADAPPWWVVIGGSEYRRRSPRVGRRGARGMLYKCHAQWSGSK